MIGFTRLRLVYESIPEDELIKNAGDFLSEHWDAISGYQDLSEEFIDRYSGKVSWVLISRYQSLSESFIEKYRYKVNWELISGYQKLSESFILNNIEKINIHWLAENEKVSKELFEKTKFMKELQS
jgi:hypothetical protein